MADAVTAALLRRGLGVETFLTGAAGDAAKRAQTIDDDIDRILVVGGDGTLNEILNGLAHPSRIPIAQLPMGTANILAHELSLPKHSEKVAALVAAGRVRHVDMGIANGKRFLMVASCGFDAMVTRVIKQNRSGSLGYKGYLLPILRTLYHYRPPRLCVCVDHGPPTYGAFVVVGNTQNYGGIFSITDRAQCDSNHLDVCVFPRGTRLALTWYYLAALARRVSRATDTRYLTGRHITITSDQPTAIEIDGDYFGQTPVEITIQPAVVPILVSP